MIKKLTFFLATTASWVTLHAAGHDSCLYEENISAQLSNLKIELMDPKTPAEAKYKVSWEKTNEKDGGNSYSFSMSRGKMTFTKGVFFDTDDNFDLEKFTKVATKVTDRLQQGYTITITTKISEV